MKKTNLVLLFFISMFFIGCGGSSQGLKKNADGVEIFIRPAGQKIRLQVINEKIIRVSATPEKKFSTEKSLMMVPQDKKVDFTVEEKNNLAVLYTDSLQVAVDKMSGEVVFMNRNGGIILRKISAEENLLPIEVEGTKGYTVRQIFESPEDEAFTD